MLIATAALLASLPLSQQVGRNVGDFFPDVELPTITRDETIRLSELRGERLLLIEFASW